MRLLIVDDEAVIKNGLMALPWETAGITQVACADNGIEAMNMICDFGPDIILADIQMPGMTGLELAGFVKEQNRMCRLILLTGYGSFSYAREAIRHGVFEYLLKPSNPQEILESVQRAVYSLKQECSGRHIEDLTRENERIFQKEENSISAILKYIEQNYMKDISLASLSESMHFSTAYLSRLIKKETGYNFVKLLAMVRMLKAAELLSMTDLKVYVICERIGIPDPRYFSQMFRKTFGHTPLEYRKLNSQKGTMNLQELIRRSKGEQE